MHKDITIPDGKDFVGISASGHKYIRLLDSQGNEVFRSNSPGEYVTAAVEPGSYTIDTDGKISKIGYGSLDERYRKGRPIDVEKPPR